MLLSRCPLGSLTWFLLYIGTIPIRSPTSCTLTSPTLMPYYPSIESIITLSNPTLLVMPKNYTGEDLQEAIQAVYNRTLLVRNAAKEWGVPA